MTDIPTTGDRWVGRYLGIWGGQASSLIGSQVVQFVLVWWLTIETGSATVLAIASLAAIVPQIALSPIAGSYVDRWKRRHIMIVADGLIALSTLVLIALFILGQATMWHIILIMLVRSSLSAFHWPASQAATTVLVPKEHLARVAGINQSMQGLASIIAPPVAAILLVTLPIETVLSIDILTAIIAIVPLLFIRFKEPSVEPGPERNVISDMREAFGFLRGWKGAFTLLAMFMLANLLLTPAFSLMPIFVLGHLNGDAMDFAATEAAGGIGILAGGIILGIWGGTKRKIVTVMATMALAGIGIALIGIVPPGGLLYVIVLLLFVGLMLPILNGSVNAMMQSCIPIDMQGRVFSMLGAMAMGATPLGLAFAGPVADTVGVPNWFIIAGVPMAIMGVLAFTVPSLMAIENGIRSTEAQPTIPPDRSI